MLEQELPVAGCRRDLRKPMNVTSKSRIGEATNIDSLCYEGMQSEPTISGEVLLNKRTSQLGFIRASGLYCVISLVFVARIKIEDRSI
jgi:hypothetical protein